MLFVLLAFASISSTHKYDTNVTKINTKSIAIHLYNVDAKFTTSCVNVAT